MRKVLTILAGSVVGIGLMAGTAAADTASCGSIVDSGPGSTNYVYCENNTKDTISCTNNIVFTDTNNQNSGSGSATTSGNTSGGNSTSGTAGNDNSTSTTLNSGCEVAAAVTPTPAPSTPSTPATTPAVATPVASTPTAVVLPETGSNTVEKDVATGSIGVGGLIVLSQLGLVAYRRFALKS